MKNMYWMKLQNKFYSAAVAWASVFTSGECFPLCAPGFLQPAVKVGEVLFATASAPLPGEDTFTIIMVVDWGNGVAISNKSRMPAFNFATLDEYDFPLVEAVLCVNYSELSLLKVV